MTVLIVLAILLVIILLGVIIVILLLPWMERWGCTADEIRQVLPGDDLVMAPERVTNRAVTIKAPPESIFAWLAQMGADKAGLYSYTWLENLVGCKMAKVEEIRPEWQDPKPGDLMKMCAKDPAPPPYEVASVRRNEFIIFYHHDEKGVADSWSFVIVPQADGSSRLISRTRTMMTGGFWEIIRPITFFMERKMLLTILRLAENQPD